MSVETLGAQGPGDPDAGLAGTQNDEDRALSHSPIPKSSAGRRSFINADVDRIALEFHRVDFQIDFRRQVDRLAGLDFETGAVQGAFDQFALDEAIAKLHALVGA